MPYCNQDIHTCMVSLRCGIVDVFWDSPALSKPCSTLQTETRIIKLHDFLYRHNFRLNIKLLYSVTSQCQVRNKALHLNNNNKYYNVLRAVPRLKGWWWNDDWQGKTKEQKRKPCSSATLSTLNLIWSYPWINLTLWSEKPASNGLSYITKMLSIVIHFILNMKLTEALLWMKFTNEPWWKLSVYSTNLKTHVQLFSVGKQLHISTL